MAKLYSLWSNKIRANVSSPWTILDSQARALADQTNGILVGHITRRLPDSEKNVVITLDIFVPTLKYSHRVLVARHKAELPYPVMIDAEVFRPTSFDEIREAARTAAMISGKTEKPVNRADSDEELSELVQQVLNSPYVVS